MVIPNNISNPDDLLEAYDKQQSWLIQTMSRDSLADFLRSDVPNATILARRLGLPGLLGDPGSGGNAGGGGGGGDPAPRAGWQGGELVFPESGPPESRVNVPPSALTGIGVPAVAATLFDPAILAGLSGEEATSSGVSSWDVGAAMDIKIYDLTTGKMVSIEDLTEPITVTLFVNDSHLYDCGYWDNSTSSWKTKGLTTKHEPNVLICSTTHLTLFGAILKGFLDTLRCTQLELLSREALREIGSSGWYGTPVAVCFWLLLAVFWLLFFIAVGMDCNRSKEGTWCDECFLVVPPPGADQPPGDEALAPADPADANSAPADPAAAEEQEETEEKKSRCQWFWKCPLVVCVLGTCSTCCSSGEFRDATDDIISNWCEHFSEIRDFCESIWDNLQISGDGESIPIQNRMLAAVTGLMGSLIARGVRGQVSTCVLMNDDVVAFVLEDEDVKELLQRGAAGEKQYEPWHKLHMSILEGVESHWSSSGSWFQVPVACAKLFLNATPFASVLMGNPFLSSTVRVLLFGADVMGSVMMTTFFFQATGTMKGKRSKHNCGGASGFGETLGRIIAIALVSWLLAGLPTRFLGSLTTRSLKQVDAENSPDWNRQLRAWRFQDKLLWVCGILYVGFCTLFVMVFLANVHPDDTPNWGYSGALSLAQDTLINPLAAALAVPIFANMTLSLISWIQGRSPAELVEGRRSQQRLRGNWSFCEGTEPVRLVSGDAHMASGWV